MNKKFTALDNAIYYIALIMSFGTLYITKVVVKKALSEMLDK